MKEQVRQIKVNDYHYELPDDRIAKYPLSNRSRSRLLIYRNGMINDDVFCNLPGILPAGTFLVFNNTRVIHARLVFRKETGAAIEVFCLEPHDPSDYQLAFQTRGPATWKCMLGNAKRWKTGHLCMEGEINGRKAWLKAEKEGTEDNLFLIRFSWNDGFTFAEVIESFGMIPLPPYLNRESEVEDSTTYQTVFARVDGSVAAPTAGLHFTGEVMDQLKGNGIDSYELTLHVGAGTFRPVKSETIAGHTMHNEYVSVDRNLIDGLLKHEGKIVAVGTTSLRSLESLYWLGIRILNGWDGEGLFEIDQWEPYQSETSFSLKESLTAILDYLKRKNRGVVQFYTRLIIVPGYAFRVSAGLVTNFHQPRSTLLLLVSAFIGPDWEKVYRYALDHGFRFLSYGDSNLYFRSV